MARPSSPKSARSKVQKLRARLRAQGLRPIEIRVPDVCAPIFKTEAHRQSLAIAASYQAREDHEFVDAISEWGNE